MEDTDTLGIPLERPSSNKVNAFQDATSASGSGVKPDVLNPHGESLCTDQGTVCDYTSNRSDSLFQSTNMKGDHDSYEADDDDEGLYLAINSIPVKVELEEEDLSCDAGRQDGYTYEDALSSSFIHEEDHTMPSKVTRCSTKFKTSAAPALTLPSPTDSSPNNEPMNVYLPSQEGTVILSAESQSSDGASQTLITSGQSVRKAKSRAVMLSPKQEQDVADWYREREWLYNFRLETYRDTWRKNSAYEEKAAELGITSAELRTWVKSKKDLALKILKQKTSGSEAKPLTNREQWVFKNFSHAAQFAKRVAEHKWKEDGQLPSRKTTVGEPGDGLMQPLLNGGDNVVYEATSSKAATHVTVNSSVVQDQLTQQVQLKRQEYQMDNRDGNRRALADLIYYASGRMDDDTFDEFQAECFTLISSCLLAARRKREFQ
ncbi:uncharacterized protein [Palaemon carinicauda]|uniref:uncharacterized protein isoform X1 n=1 Tax=Palaemon carinicauda TaxID=392227 RepID=UPI0035B631B6